MVSDELEPTAQEYHIRCKVLIKEIPVEDLGKRFTRKICCLIPDGSDQTTLFYSAWLPEVEGQFFEVGMMIENFGLARGAVILANPNLSQKHIHVMSVGVKDDIIKNKKSGDYVKVIILPEGDEAGLDSTREADGSYDLVPNLE